MKILFGLPPINRLEVVGRVVSHPEAKRIRWQPRKGGPERMRTFVKFKIEHYNRRAKKSLHIWVNVWGAMAEWLVTKARLERGDPVWLYGALDSRRVKWADGTRMFYYFVARDVYFVPEIPNKVRQGKNYLVPAEPFDRFTAAFNNSGYPHISDEDFERILGELEEAKSNGMVMPQDILDLKGDGQDI